VHVLDDVVDVDVTNGRQIGLLDFPDLLVG
jgi:hypothetical protein